MPVSKCKPTARNEIRKHMRHTLQSQMNRTTTYIASIRDIRIPLVHCVASVSTKERKAIEARYKSLAKKDSYCDLHDVLLMPELAFNPYVEYVLSLVHQEIQRESSSSSGDEQAQDQVDGDGDGDDARGAMPLRVTPDRVSYCVLLRTLAIFHPSTARKEKLRGQYHSTQEVATLTTPGSSMEHQHSVCASTNC
jgi:hypothetical protein